MKIQLPFLQNSSYPITQQYDELFLYKNTLYHHKGLDFGCPAFTPVLSPFDAVVSEVKQEEEEKRVGFGFSLLLTAINNIENLECFIGNLNSITVNVGYKVKISSFLAYSGNTGFTSGTTGEHLHFELRKNGKAINPKTVLKIDQDQSNLFNFNDPSKLKSFLGFHTIQENETLWTISQKYYNNGGHFIDIFLANQDILINYLKLTAGKTIRIPALVNKGI